MGEVQGGISPGASTGRHTSACRWRRRDSIISTLCPVEGAAWSTRGWRCRDGKEPGGVCSVGLMRAEDTFRIELTTAPAGSWWRVFLARVFRTLGDYPQPHQVLVAELSSGRLLASLDGGAEMYAEMAADLSVLAATEFAHKWLPAGVWPAD